MRVAFLGSRGIPRCYSGFETFVEEIATRLVERGHFVTVYNRIPFNSYRERTFRGVRILPLPTLPYKGTDTLVHSALSTGHALTQHYDILYYCGVGSSIFSLPAKWGGAKTLVNVDGADWQRAKWGQLGKTWLRWSERFAGRLADCVIADHPMIAERYQRQFGVTCATITYGAEVVVEDPGRTALDELSLTPRSYFLYVSRLTPENRADLVMEAYLAAKPAIPLVVVGDAPYTSDFQQKLKALAASSNGSIRMTGYRFGDGYRQLSFHAQAFLFPTTIEATRPVLIEQMGMGGLVIACDTVANRFLLGDAALWFDPNDAQRSLADQIRAASGLSIQREQYAELARERVRKNHNWDRITDQYERLFAQLLGENS